MQFITITELFKNNNSEKYQNDIINLLSQLTDCPEISLNNIINMLPKNQYIFILMDESIIAGMGTVIIEQKIIHNGMCVGHIEDIIIKEEYRKKGFGKIIIEYLTNFAKNNNCYKVILNCSDFNMNFYINCGFNLKSNGMALYF